MIRVFLFIHDDVYVCVYLEFNYRMYTYKKAHTNSSDISLLYDYIAKNGCNIAALSSSETNLLFAVATISSGPISNLDQVSSKVPLLKK